jgi:hypothetical protein
LNTENVYTKKAESARSVQARPLFEDISTKLIYKIIEVLRPELFHDELCKLRSEYVGVLKEEISRYFI